MQCYQSGSKRISRFAPMRFKPTPPAFADNMKILALQCAELNYIILFLCYISIYTNGKMDYFIDEAHSFAGFCSPIKTYVFIASLAA